MTRDFRGHGQAVLDYHIMLIKLVLMDIYRARSMPPTRACNTPKIMLSHYDINPISGTPMLQSGSTLWLRTCVNYANLFITIDAKGFQHQFRGLPMS